MTNISSPSFLLSCFESNGLLGLEPDIALLSGIGVAFGVAGWLATSANVQELFPDSVASAGA